MARRFALSRARGPGLEIDFEADLNVQQLAAVTCGDGPKLVIAGAGTGKTRTLTYRVAWLLKRGIGADRILLVTFTNKAAREMVERLRRLTGIDTGRLWGGTFHSVGARILRRHSGELGYTERFSILDDTDQRDLLRLCVTDVGVPVERRRFPSPRVLRSMISLCANTDMALADVIADRYARFLDWEEEILAVAERYRRRKLSANAMDYDDLLLNWLRLLRDRPEIAQRYGERLQYLLVDEYQDTNLPQGGIVEELAHHNGGNLMVVGDDCQSIYAFRGAHYDNILHFAERNPGTEVFKLEINYRSTPQILALTNASIRGNSGQFAKRLEARRSGGPLPGLVPCSYADQEAAFVVERVLQLRDEGTPLHRIAILYRAHSHRLDVETTLLRHDVPYEVRGGVRFFEQAHIKDVTAFLRVADNPRDEVAFRRALLLQPGIGNVTAARIFEALGRGGGALRDRLAEPTLAGRLGARARAGWEALRATILRVLDAASDPEQALRAVLEGGYEQYAACTFDNYDSRMEEIEQLAVFAARYENVAAFLQELVLLGEMYGQDVAVGHGHDDQEARVVLSTVHQAKGLEWDVVFLIHLVEGAFPSPRALDDDGGEGEERRIFYVATTRARKELYLSYPIVRPGGFAAGSLLQQPSRFLAELPPDVLEPWQLCEPEADGDLTGASSQAHADEWDPNLDPLYDDEEYPQ